MDIYQSTVNYLLGFPIFDTWGEMRAMLQRAASTHPRDWELPILGCRTVGASAERAIPASAALACAQISIILVDDMLDEDPRGEYQRIGHGRSSNLASAFQAAALEALVESHVDPSIRLEALDTLSQMMLTTAYGQELDLRSPSDETSYWCVVENKSAPFYGCALQLGALFGEANADIVRSLEQLGRLYGEMIQIHDDLNDTMAVPANPDWLQKRRPLPILFALSVDHPNRARFLELYQDISNQNALQEAQEILINCGGVSYCVDQLVRRYQGAQGILNKTPLPGKGTMDALIEGILAPVWRLFKALDLSPEIPSTIAAQQNQE
ncbi:MAG TPA: polyprenyl synthetase family protein [Anaerolineales bacterium]|nr:polyprenyl synthetase family protein [Anaerolineales bacterium]